MQPSAAQCTAGFGCHCAGFAALLIDLLPCQADLPFTFRAWTTHDGLPENQVTCLTQTRDG